MHTTSCTIPLSIMWEYTCNTEVWEQDHKPSPFRTNQAVHLPRNYCYILYVARYLLKYIALYALPPPAIGIHIKKRRYAYVYTLIHIRAPYRSHIFISLGLFGKLGLLNQLIHVGHRATRGGQNASGYWVHRTGALISVGWGHEHKQTKTEIYGTL